MEELTKHQLILVALLVSFVTSIATGIVTVALMQQAPTGVTQTVNHVIQETVEKVVPSEAASVAGSQASAGGTVTVVAAPSESDLIAAAVVKNSKSLIRIMGTATQNPPVFLGLGTLVSSDGFVVAGSDVAAQGMTYTGVLSDGTTTPLTMVAQNQGSQLAYFRLGSAGDSSATDAGAGVGAAIGANPDPQALVPAPLGNSDLLKIGQSVIVLGGENQDSIARGIVTSLDRNESLLSGGFGSDLLQIETDAPFAEQASALIDPSSGAVLGFEMPQGSESGNGNAAAGTGPVSDFLPVNMVKDELNALRPATASSTAQGGSSASTATSTTAINIAS